MSNERTIARPYANSVFDVAKEREQIPNWVGYFGIASALKANNDAMKLLASPKQNADSISNLFKQIASSEAIGDEVLSNIVNGVNSTVSKPPSQWEAFLNVLIANDRLALLPVIAEIFIEKVQTENSIVPVFVTAAQPMSKTDKETLQARLAERLQKKIDITLETDKSLLGGIVIKVGDTVIDGSVKGKLDAMRQSLAL